MDCELIELMAVAIVAGIVGSFIGFAIVQVLYYFWFDQIFDWTDKYIGPLIDRLL